MIPCRMGSPKQRGDKLVNSLKLQNPQVSVIIPTYNHAHYLGDAIQSVLHQTYQDFEIIVVDDGSTDDTHAVVDRYGDQVRYLWQENRGLSGARNTGIQAAQGAFIGLLDADDLYEPKFLSTLVPFLDANNIAPEKKLLRVFVSYEAPVGHVHVELMTFQRYLDLVGLVGSAKGINSLPWRA